MSALHGTLSNALPTCLSLASRMWKGGAGCTFVNFRPIISTNPFRRQTRAAPQASQSDYSTSTVQSISGTQGRRAYADYTFYKGKGAMCMKPGKPVFRTLDTGAAVLEREGSLYLEFAPSLGPRQYDWPRKQVMALSVSELGTLIGLSTTDNCEFYHDPMLGKSDAGKVRKILKVEPMSDGLGGFFFNFQVSNKIEGSETRVTVGLTKAEYFVLRSSVNYLIPYLIGWHMIVDPSKLDEHLSDDAESNPVNEWDR